MSVIHSISALQACRSRVVAGPPGTAPSDPSRTGGSAGRSRPARPCAPAAARRPGRGRRRVRLRLIVPGQAGVPPASLVMRCRSREGASVTATFPTPQFGGAGSRAGPVGAVSTPAPRCRPLCVGGEVLDAGIGSGDARARARGRPSAVGAHAAPHVPHAACPRRCGRGAGRRDRGATVGWRRALAGL